MSGRLVLKMAGASCVLVAAALWMAPPETLIVLLSGEGTSANKAVAKLTDASPTKAAQGSPSYVNPLTKLSIGTFSKIVERPLFNPTRAGPPHVAEAPPPVQAEQPPLAAKETVTEADFTLMAVAGTDGKRVALVRREKTGEVYHLKQGDILADWTLSKIESREIVLDRDGILLSLKLFVATSTSAHAEPDATQPNKP